MPDSAIPTAGRSWLHRTPRARSWLHDVLPNSEIHPLGAGHFAWEQAPQEYGRLVAAWVGGGYRRVGAAS